MDKVRDQKTEALKFLDAVGSGFAHYADFSGRSPSSAAGRWYLFDVFVTMIAVVLDVVLRTSTVLSISVFGGLSDAGLITSITGLALLVPTLSMGVRRLHDIDKSGWWLLLAVVPIIGWLVLLSFLLQDGKPDANRFGLAPLDSRQAAANRAGVALR